MIEYIICKKKNVILYISPVWHLYINGIKAWYITWKYRFELQFNSLYIRPPWRCWCRRLLCRSSRVSSSLSACSCSCCPTPSLAWSYLVQSSTDITSAGTYCLHLIEACTDLLGLVTTYIYIRTSMNKARLPKDLICDIKHSLRNDCNYIFRWMEVYLKKWIVHRIINLKLTTDIFYHLILNAINSIWCWSCQQRRYWCCLWNTFGYVDGGISCVFTCQN